MAVEIIQSSATTISSLGEESVINPLKSILETLLRQCYDVSEALSPIINRPERAPIVDNDLSAALEQAQVICISNAARRYMILAVEYLMHNCAGTLKCIKRSCQTMHLLSAKLLLIS